MFDELKDIQKKVDKAGFSEDQIAFYLCCDQVQMPFEDPDVLKDILVKNKVISQDDNVSLTKIDDHVKDLEVICREWRFDDEITAELIRIVDGADAYYLVWADGSYESYGHLWSECRLVQSGEEFVLLEFYICD